MTFPSDLHYRQSLRLKGYNYTQAGAHFITICTQSRECLFGDIIDGRMLLNDAGHMIPSVWNQLPQYYPGVDVDAFVVMPNHIHGIIVLTVGAGTGACPYLVQESIDQGRLADSWLARDKDQLALSNQS